MATLSGLYGSSLALLTDLYQLTMAASYWHAGLAQREAVFHLFYRRPPFDGQYAIAAGLENALEFLERFRFGESDLEYLASLRGNADRPLFSGEFLDELRRMRFACDVDAVPEGTLIFPHEPLIRVRGPIWQAQLLETPLLTLINFPTLIATKAARVCQAAQGDPVIDFGLRRAQGIDGGVTAARAAMIGGCAGSSNVLAGKLFDIPVRGTHAHSWVMAFDSEREAFQRYAEAMPDNAVFLVDTYDTVEGVRQAAAVGQDLRAGGHQMIGVRLDSGDLTQLSQAARRILDEHGLHEAKIVASNDLDERRIAQLKREGCQVNVWGVGTRLVTAHDDPSLTGVYKLAAIRDDDGGWRPKVKRSEQAAKSSNPGVQQVRRFWDGERMVGDCIHDLDHGCPAVPEIRGPQGGWTALTGEPEDLLEPVVQGGTVRKARPTLAVIRERTQRQLAALAPEVRRLENPEPYPCGLERRLAEVKQRLLASGTD